MKFVKKRIPVEAEQYFGDASVPVDGVCFCAGSPHIHTLESNAFTVSDGDWIITGIKGEKYACKPDIFELTYEKVEE